MEILAPDVLSSAPRSTPHKDYEQQLADIPAEALHSLPCPAYGPKTAQPVFIHLYSGRQREGDFQAELESLEWGEAWSPIEISLDIVINSRTGNVFDHTVRKAWINASSPASSPASWWGLNVRLGVSQGRGGFRMAVDLGH